MNFHKHNDCVREGPRPEMSNLAQFAGLHRIAGFGDLKLCGPNVSARALAMWKSQRDTLIFPNSGTCDGFLVVLRTARAKTRAFFCPDCMTR